MSNFVFLKAETLKLQCESESLSHEVHHMVSDPEGLGRSLRIFISNKFPVVTNAV